MSEHQKIKKLLKGPDRFQLAIAYLLRLVEANASRLAILGGTILLAGAGFAGWQYWQHSTLEGRRNELAQVEHLRSKADNEANKKKLKIQEKIDALTPKANALESQAKPSLEVAQKSADLEKQLEAIKPDYSALLPAYEAFLKKHPKTPEAWIAGIRIANLHLSAKNLAAARPFLETVIQESAKNIYFAAYARYILINLAVEEKQYDLALSTSQELVELVPSEMKAQAMILQAKVLLAKGDRQEASKTLDALLKDHATAPEAQTAKSMKALMVN